MLLIGNQPFDGRNHPGDIEIVHGGESGSERQRPK